MRISTYPTHFVQTVTVEINTNRDSHCIIALTSETGKILRMMGVDLNQGHNHITIDDLDALTAGTYLLHVKNVDGDFLYDTELIKP